MSIKYLYIRDRKNIQHRKDGSTTRGNPIAVVGTEIDRKDGIIYYAVASAHTKDHFVKSLARTIASGRLNLLDRTRVRPAEGLDSGWVYGNEVDRVLAMRNGHEITKLVMKEIVRLSKFPASIRKVPSRVGRLASDWLAFAAIAKSELPTMPNGKLAMLDDEPWDDEVVAATHNSLPHA